MLCRTLNVRVRNMGFTQQTMGIDSEKINSNVRGLEDSSNTLDPLEAPYPASRHALRNL